MNIYGRKTDVGSLSNVYFRYVKGLRVFVRSSYNKKNANIFCGCLSDGKRAGREANYTFELCKYSLG